MPDSMIMIPVFNGEKYIARSIESALNQTLKTEIWVVDNSSTDATREVVKGYLRRYKNLRLFVNNNNLGRVGNWNRCLDLFENSKYKYIKWLFAGDELFPDCIKEVEKAFLVDKNIAAIAFPYEFKNTDGRIDVVRDYRGNHLFGLKKMKRINLVDGGLLSTIVCNAYNRKYINGYRFNELFITKNDFDFKIFSNGKGYYIDKVLARFNVEARMTYHKAIDYITETEFVFNRAYWLEKLKNSFTKKEYIEIREQIYIDFVIRNMDYYPLGSIFKMLRLVLLKLSKLILIRIAESKNKLLNYD